MDILKEVKELTGRGEFVFPSIRTKQRPMSENTLTSALRRLGYSGEEMTAHGFRSMASTMLHEQGYNSDWVERQLAHVDSNSVRASYNYAQYLTERKQMMQDWADYLDSLRQGADVVAINARSAG
jgi:integrase